MSFPPVHGKAPSLASVEGAGADGATHAGAQTTKPALSAHVLPRYRVVDAKNLADRPATRVSPRPMGAARLTLEHLPQMRSLFRNFALALGRDKDLAARFIAALRGQVLDLSGLSAHVIERLRPEVWAVLSELALRPVDSVILPKGLTAWPLGLESFSDLAIVALPGFKSRTLELPAEMIDALVVVPIGEGDDAVTVRRAPAPQHDGAPSYSSERSRSVADALSHFLDALGGPTLDLGLMSPQALARLPQGAWQLPKLSQGAAITAVTLPAGLSALPQGIERLGALVSVTLPDFKGVRVVLPYALRSARVHVPGTAQIVKVTLERPDGKGDFERDKPAGHIYFRQSPEGRDHDAIVTENFNYAARLVSGEVVACRHLAMAQVLSRIEYLEARATAARGRFSYADFSSLHRISGCVEHLTDDLWEEILTGQRCENVALPLHELSLALRQRFTAMRRERMPVMHFFMISFNHALTLELRIKTDHSGAPRYALTLFDPNRTLTHRRMVVSDLHHLRVDIEDWLGRPHTENYFKSADEGFVRLIAVVKADLVGGADRPVQGATFYQARQAPLGEQEVLMLALMNATGELRERLAHLPTAREARRIALTARPGEYGPLFGACAVEMVHLYLQSVVDDRVLTSDDKFDIFNATYEGETFLGRVVRLEADDWLEVLVNTYLASDLTQQQKVALLMPRIQGTDAIQLLPPERQRLFMRLLGQASGVQLSKEAREVLGARMGLVVPVPDPASTALATATPTAAGAGSGLSG